MDNINIYLKKYKKSGDKIWFEKIYQHFMPKIYRYFYFKVLDKQMAEDLTSELFIKVYKNLMTANLNSRAFRAWIYKIAKNLLIDFYRKTGKDKEEALQFEGFEDKENSDLVEDNFFIKNSSIIEKELGFQNCKLIEAMNKLTKLQRDVLLLKFIEDFDYKTIADIFEKKQLTIRGILFRALAKLKSEINN